MCIGEQNLDGGKIYLNNKSIEQIPIHLRSKEGLGYLPQQRSVFNMSVYDKIQSSGTAILVTDHNVKNLFDITDRSYVLGEHTVIAEGTSRELLKSSKAIEHYFGSQFS